MGLLRHLGSFTRDLLSLSLWLVLLLMVFVPLERIFGKRSQKVFRRSFVQVASRWSPSPLRRTVRHSSMNSPPMVR